MVRIFVTFSSSATWRLIVSPGQWDKTIKSIARVTDFTCAKPEVSEPVDRYCRLSSRHGL